MMYSSGMPTTTVIMQKPMPHKIVNPHCHKCHGSGFNAHKHKPCKLCVCSKCGGYGVKLKNH